MRINGPAITVASSLLAFLAVGFAPSSAVASTGTHLARLTAESVEPTPATSSADCPNGSTCWYGDGGFSGWLEYSAAVQTTNVTYPRQMSSWINRNSRAAAWFTGANGTGTGHCMPPNIEVSQVTPSENDTMVSFKIYSGTSC